ncbi:MAG: hydantoinase/oxoprolinase family protein [Acidimicrobiales bacterium]
MEPLLLGVDTGGTYTDAVLLRSSDRTVVSSAKALTTRDDLAIGVSNALDSIASDLDPRRVGLVSISTTLATNAVVEGHGSPVLVLLVGFDDAMVRRSGISDAFSDVMIERVAGGHDHHGAERAALDLDVIRSILNTYDGQVRAVAVAASFAVRNPAHEHAIRDLVLAETELPVTVSSVLSESLDAPRRALTATLNARLLSRISDLVDAVRRSLDELGVDAPVMVAKGDGSLAAAEAVERRPIETILSGPAASIVGASVLAGLDDFVLSDIGGTTTDVGQLVDGRPRLAPEGAKVGGWRTMVSAIDVRTTGLGGDSEIRTEGNRVTVGPQRRVPLALLGSMHERIAPLLRADLLEPPPREIAAAFVLAVGDPAAAIGDAVSSTEARVLSRLTDAPMAMRDVALGVLERRAVASLADKGLVQVAGFTPSDAAHVLGMQDNWEPAAAEAGAQLLAWYTGQTVEDFCRDVWSEVVRRSAGCVLEVALDATDDPLLNPIVVAAVAGAGVHGRTSVSISPLDPIVAVGGPAAVYYPEVAQRLGGEVVLPESFEVANAVGAAAGQLVARSGAAVHTDGPGLFRIVSGTGVETATRGRDALDRAEVAATAVATALIEEMRVGLPGVGPIESHIEITRHDDPTAGDDDGLYGATVQVELRAHPATAR